MDKHQIICYIGYTICLCNFLPRFLWNKIWFYINLTKLVFPIGFDVNFEVENSYDNFSFHKPKITVDDFILFSTYSAIFYQYVEFNYGNKDRSPLENVKFYRNDKSAKLTDDEVSILGYIRHSDDLPIRRRPLSILSRSSSVVTTKHKVLPEKYKADSFHIWCKSSFWLGESKLFISALLHSNGPNFTYFKNILLYLCTCGWNTECIVM